MKINRAEVEFAGDQEDDGPDGGQAREASGATLGLKEAVASLQKSIGLSGLCPGHYALQVTTNECGDLLP